MRRRRGHAEHPEAGAVRDAAVALRADIERLLSEGVPSASGIVEEAGEAFGLRLAPGETKRGLWQRLKPHLDQIIDDGGPLA